MQVEHQYLFLILNFNVFSIKVLENVFSYWLFIVISKSVHCSWEIFLTFPDRFLEFSYKRKFEKHNMLLIKKYDSGGKCAHISRLLKYVHYREPIWCYEQYYFPAPLSHTNQRVEKEERDVGEIRKGGKQ